MSFEAFVEGNGEGNGDWDEDEDFGDFAAATPVSEPVAEDVHPNSDGSNPNHNPDILEGSFHASFQDFKVDSVDMGVDTTSTAAAALDLFQQQQGETTSVTSTESFGQSAIHTLFPSQPMPDNPLSVSPDPALVDPTPKILPEEQDGETEAFNAVEGHIDTGAAASVLNADQHTQEAQDTPEQAVLSTLSMQGQHPNLDLETSTPYSEAHPHSTTTETAEEDTTTVGKEELHEVLNHRIGMHPSDHFVDLQENEGSNAVSTPSQSTRVAFVEQDYETTNASAASVLAQQANDEGMNDETDDEEDGAWEVPREETARPLSELEYEGMLEETTDSQSAPADENSAIHETDVDVNARDGAHDEEADESEVSSQLNTPAEVEYEEIDEVFDEDEDGSNDFGALGGNSLQDTAQFALEQKANEESDDFDGSESASHMQYSTDVHPQPGTVLELPTNRALDDFGNVEDKSHIQTTTAQGNLTPEPGFQKLEHSEVEESDDFGDFEAASHVQMSGDGGMDTDLASHVQVSGDAGMDTDLASHVQVSGDGGMDTDLPHPQGNETDRDAKTANPESSSGLEMESQKVHDWADFGDFESASNLQEEGVNSAYVKQGEPPAGVGHEQSVEYEDFGDFEAASETPRAVATASLDADAGHVGEDEDFGDFEGSGKLSRLGLGLGLGLGQTHTHTQEGVEDFGEFESSEVPATLDAHFSEASNEVQPTPFANFVDSDSRQSDPNPNPNANPNPSSNPTSYPFQEWVTRLSSSDVQFLPKDLSLCEGYHNKLRDIFPQPTEPPPSNTAPDMEEVLNVFSGLTRSQRLSRRPSESAAERWIDDVIRTWVARCTPDDVIEYYTAKQSEIQHEKHPTPRRSSNKPNPALGLGLGLGFHTHTDTTIAITSPTSTGTDPFDSESQPRHTTNTYQASEFDLDFLATFGLSSNPNPNPNPNPAKDELSKPSLDDGMDMDFFMMSSSVPTPIHSRTHTHIHTRTHTPSTLPTLAQVPSFVGAEGPARLGPRALDFMEGLPDLSYLLPVTLPS